MPDRITIVIETEGSAFSDSPSREVARILRAMADRLEQADMLPAPMDLYGNTCGSVTIEPL